MNQFPAEFSIELYNPQALSARLSQLDTPSSSGSDPSAPLTTRLKYARIRLVDIGVLTSPRKHHPIPVPFNLILEPLYFGILPASVIPILLFLIPVIILAGLLVPWVNGYLSKIVMKARDEITGHKQEKED
jgi:hypothetical protein